jgi:ATP-binding cassette subfamily C (CFTR/MRP) protein 1
VKKQGKGGAVDIQNITVRYRDDLEPVIQSLSLNIPAGSKVGICGRTGCGKSSTLLALLRLNIISEGDVLIDGESLLGMDLETARSRISVIPQDPHLFSGTVRFNLDPFEVYTDQEIWAALEDAHIKEYVSSDTLGLFKLVEEGGKNFSVGQRQLLSLARAILRRCEIVLMDEVTASIDYVTDGLIQETIRSSEALKHSTIITVAHRLRTIADSDIVVVMAVGGTVAEKGPPAELLSREDSQFRALAEETNELEEILRIAQPKGLLPSTDGAVID